jgi:hypothetical protein
MTLVLVLLAILVAGGAVVAVGAAVPRFAALGMFVALVGSAYVADPMPDTLALASRLVGSTLGAYLVWIALRRAPVLVPGVAVAWPGAAAIAIAAFVTGWLAAGTLGAALAAGSGDGPGLGSAGAALAAGSPVARAALGASLALAAVAVAPVVIARDLLRTGIGLLLLLASATLLRNALGTSADPVFELAIAVLTAASGAAIGAVITSALRRTGDLVLRDSFRRDAAVRHRAADDAHPTADGAHHGADGVHRRPDVDHQGQDGAHRTSDGDR